MNETETTDDWTHISREAGNGFPDDGDIVQDQDGESLALVRTSTIHTDCTKANYVYCLCEATSEDAGEDAHRVEVLT